MRASGLARLVVTALASGVGAVCAAASVGLAAGAAPDWTAVSAWLIGVAAVEVDAERARRAHAEDRVGGGLGRQLAARVLLSVAAGIGAARECPQQRTIIWFGIVVVIAAVVVEPVVARAQPRREVAALPGFRDAPGLAITPWLVPATTGIIVLAGLLGVVSVGSLVRVILPVAAVGVLGVAAGVGGLNARDRGPRRARLRQALEGHAPRFAVYTGREDGGVYQVAMWLPYLEQLGLPYVVVTRRAAAVRALAGITAAPVVARDAWRDLDDVVVPSLGAAFYVNSVASNSNFVTYRQMTHVYLGHGDSDKPLSFHPQHAMFDRVFVAGPAAIERYARNGVAMRADAFVVVGRPQLADLRRGPDDASVSTGTRTVLYAPTWAGYNRASRHSSLDRGVEIAQALLDRGATVVFRPHPFSRDRPAERAQAQAVDALLRADSAATGRAHRFGPDVDRVSFIRCANEADALIADISGVLVDFLAADKPMAVTVTGAVDPAEFVERFPVARGAYLLELARADGRPASTGLPKLPDLPELSDLLGDDPRRGVREAIRDYYLGGLDGPGSVAAFLAAARAAIES